MPIARIRLALLVPLAMLPAACDLPRDPARTTELIRENGVIRLGMIEGVAREPAAERELAAAAQLLGARVERTSGPGEELLEKLERGELDLVYGSFAMNSPWARNVQLGRAPGWRVEPPSDHAAPRFAFRTGENGWVMTMERLKP